MTFQPNQNETFQLLLLSNGYPLKNRVFCLLRPLFLAHCKTP